MATPSHPPIVNENNKPIKGSALIRLYKPANIFPISFSLFHVCPYLSCDTRGAGTLFNTKKARYYLLSLGQLKTTGIRTNNFSRCGEHYNEINACHKSGLHIPRDTKYYADELNHHAKKKKRSPREVKHIHSNRLGISYDVVIKMYKDIPARQHAKLPDSMKWQYFKEYKHLKFDILRSLQQIQQFNRLNMLVLSQNANAKYKRPFV
ncbi:hypothetical protein GLOIN_2v1779171 [Rhizophagus clarus]|uniref:Uncharacterized protein n=1 Tax=Rhizophagus clarus TaxID=94130 RepID=A0A8H3LVV1_9GLOM|nr:hypothetical protein GLOIN_2v1779171 [Rhizophagus clarus]